MMRVPARIVLLVIFFGLSHFAFEAKACTCGPRDSVYKEYQDASAVFVGKVIGSRDAQLSRVYNDQTYQHTERIFQFAVSEGFKGVTGSFLDISAGVVESSCYGGFVTGQTYLVYAFRSGENALSSSGFCSRTTDMVHAAPDVHYIRQLLRGVPEPRVYGSVERLESAAEGDRAVRRAVPLPGIKVSIEGEGKRFEALTDEQGRFQLDDFPDGTYKARPLLPDRRYKTYYMQFEEFTLVSKAPTIHRKKAVTLNFHVAWNNELTGRILDSEGKPIRDANVALLLPRDPVPVSIEERSSHRPDGEFMFPGLVPGGYLLAVNFWAPFEDKTKRTYFYYPGTENLDQTERIEIGIDQIVNNKDIRLPPGYVVRTIKGVLVWPNGVSVSRARVMLTGSKDSLNKDEAYDWSYTDEHGRFSLQAFVGAEYWIFGESGSSGKGEPIKIKVENDNKPLKIVIPLPKRVKN